MNETKEQLLLHSDIQKGITANNRGVLPAQTYFLIVLDMQIFELTVPQKIALIYILMQTIR